MINTNYDAEYWKKKDIVRQKMFFMGISTKREEQYFLQNLLLPEDKYENNKQIIIFSEEEEKYILIKLMIINIHSFDKASKKQWELVEERIAKIPEVACRYAIDGLKKQRFEKGEEAILKSPEFACMYAINCIRERWEEGEKVIYSHPLYTELYCEFLAEKKAKHLMEILKNTKPSCIYEKIYYFHEEILEEDKKNPFLGYEIVATEFMVETDPIFAALYSEWIQKKGYKFFDKYEDFILTDSFASAYYAARVKKEAWEIAENIICRCAESSYYYARYALKGVFEKGENAIKSNPYYFCNYMIYLNKIGYCDLRKYEDCAFKDPTTLLEYMRIEKKDRCKKVEQALLGFAESPYLAGVLVNYCRHFIKGEWKEAEHIISKYGFYSMIYAAYCKKGKFEQGEDAIIKKELLKFYDKFLICKTFDYIQFVDDYFCKLLQISDIDYFMLNRNKKRIARRHLYNENLLILPGEFHESDFYIKNLDFTSQ